MDAILRRSSDELAALLPAVKALGPALGKLGTAMMSCWAGRGKVLTCGNGGSAADAIHLAEELVARFQKDRRGLAAVSLTDPGVLTCAGNDFGYERIFSRQVEALGNPGDVLIVFTTSGNSPNILRAVDAAKAGGLITASFLGKTGGKLKGVCDIELHVPADTAHRTQECHQLLYHALCEWIDTQVS